jgi:hypothetical protein
MSVALDVFGSAALNLVAGAAALGNVAGAAAFGVFGGFQITNFDVFLGCHNTSFAALGLLFVLCQ